MMPGVEQRELRKEPPAKAEINDGTRQNPAYRGRILSILKLIGAILGVIIWCIWKQIKMKDEARLAHGSIWPPKPKKKPKTDWKKEGF